MSSIDLGGEFALEGGGRIVLRPLRVLNDRPQPNNLIRVDAAGNEVWAAAGEFSGAWFDGLELRAYDTYGFNKTIDVETGEVVRSIFTK